MTLRDATRRDASMAQAPGRPLAWRRAGRARDDGKVERGEVARMLLQAVR